MRLFAGTAPLAALLCGLAASPVQAQPQPASAECDRWCLKGIVDGYVAAMLKHDVSAVSTAPGVVVTENTKPIKLGEGAFASATRMISGENQTQYVMDTQSGEVGYLGILDAGGPAFYALRLKVVDRRITEIETMVMKREDGAPFWPEAYLLREAPYIRDIPKPVRTSRSGLVKTATAYWRVAATTHKGSSVPYTQDCFHYENGMNTNWERPLLPWEKDSYVQPSDGRIWICAREVDLTTLRWTKTRDIHYLVDEERGLVMSWAFADVNPAAGWKPPAQADGKPSPRPTWFYPPPFGFGPTGMGSAGAGPGAPKTEPYALYQAVVMRIIDGKISREQVFHRDMEAGASRPFPKGPLDPKEDFQPR